MMEKETDNDGIFNPFRSDGTWTLDDVTCLTGTNDYKSAPSPFAISFSSVFTKYNCYQIPNFFLFPMNNEEDKCFLSWIP